MIFTKEWTLKEGSYNRALALDRIHALNVNSNVRSIAPKHSFTLSKQKLTCSYVGIQKANFNYSEHKSSLLPLAEGLDALAADKIPHGDIKYANCIWDGHRWQLIDWEPILEYRIHGGIVFRTTKPYISSADLKSEKITASTDKIGFYFLIKRLKNGWENPSSLKIHEAEMQILNSSFKEILSLLESNNLKV